MIQQISALLSIIWILHQHTLYEILQLWWNYGGKWYLSYNLNLIKLCTIFGKSVGNFKLNGALPDINSNTNIPIAHISTFSLYF